MTDRKLGGAFAIGIVGVIGLALVRGGDDLVRHSDEIGGIVIRGVDPDDVRAGREAPSSIGRSAGDSAQPGEWAPPAPAPGSGSDTDGPFRTAFSKALTAKAAELARSPGSGVSIDRTSGILRIDARRPTPGKGGRLELDIRDLDSLRDTPLGECLTNEQSERDLSACIERALIDMTGVNPHGF